MGSVPQGNGETILVVEDEAMLLALLQQGLQSLGYDVIAANNGQDAYALIQSGAKFDLLLTDIMMPGDIDGFRLATLVRDIDAAKPIVYISGYTGLTFDERYVVKAPIVQKPATKAEIGAALRLALGQTTA